MGRGRRARALESQSPERLEIEVPDAVHGSAAYGRHMAADLVAPAAPAAPVVAQVYIAPTVLAKWALGCFREPVQSSLATYPLSYYQRSFQRRQCQVVAAVLVEERSKSGEEQDNWPGCNQPVRIQNHGSASLPGLTLVEEEEEGAAARMMVVPEGAEGHREHMSVEWDIEAEVDKAQQEQVQEVADVVKDDLLLEVAIQAEEGRSAHMEVGVTEEWSPVSYRVLWSSAGEEVAEVQGQSELVADKEQVVE